jgi:hypothetical protein
MQVDNKKNEVKVEKKEGDTDDDDGGGVGEEENYSPQQRVLKPISSISRK